MDGEELELLELREQERKVCSAQVWGMKNKREIDSPMDLESILSLISHQVNGGKYLNSCIIHPFLHSSLGVNRALVLLLMCCERSL